MIKPFKYLKDRRKEPGWKKRIDLVKNVWIISGLIALLLQSPAIFFVLTILASFLTFFILDEVDVRDED